ncbi:MAG: hypothetical protein GY754_00230, partial [bacterium]|nr:hypothetical protein [bacterium]
ELKVVIAIAYLTAVFINLPVLLNEYRLMDGLMEEVKILSEKNKFKSQELNNHVQGMSFKTGL